jgi:hypothetical protein
MPDIAAAFIQILPFVAASTLKTITWKVQLVQKQENTVDVGQLGKFVLGFGIRIFK